MLTRLVDCAAIAALCIATAGCAGGSGCAGSPYAFMKYDCACETCGPGFCTSCDDQANGCGNQIGCGDGCHRGSSCRSGGGRRGWLVAALCDCTGCGECYWNEWYNDPPSCAEPCDCCGNWIGPGHQCTCCSPKPFCCGGCANGYAGSPPPLELAEAPSETTAE